MRLVLLVCLTTALLVSQTAAAQDSPTDSWRVPPEYGYVHAGFGGNMYYVNGDELERVLSPFELSAVNFGYCLYAVGGFRNIAQLELRTGKESSNFTYDSGFTPEGKIARTQIPMKFSHSQWLIKLNALSVVPGKRESCLFIIYGMGSVEFLDDRGDGFMEGNKTIVGIEWVKIYRFAQAGISLERHHMNFERFAISGFGQLRQQFDATAWLLLFKFSAGFGK